VPRATGFLRAPVHTKDLEKAVWSRSEAEAGFAPRSWSQRFDRWSPQVVVITFYAAQVKCIAAALAAAGVSAVPVHSVDSFQVLLRIGMTSGRESESERHTDR